MKNININMKHFPDAVFNFLKHNRELATLTKLFSFKRRVVCTPYLLNLRKVEIFALSGVRGLRLIIFFKTAGSCRRLNEIEPIIYPVLEHMSTMYDKNLVENSPAEAG